jgi:hypothetical protein
MAYSLLHMWFHPLLLHGFLRSEKVVDGIIRKWSPSVGTWPRMEIYFFFYGNLREGQIIYTNDV